MNFRLSISSCKLYILESFFWEACSFTVNWLIIYKRKILMNWSKTYPLRSINNFMSLLLEHLDLRFQIDLVSLNHISFCFVWLNAQGWVIISFFRFFKVFDARLYNLVHSALSKRVELISHISKTLIVPLCFSQSFLESRFQMLYDWLVLVNWLLVWLQDLETIYLFLQVPYLFL